MPSSQLFRFKVVSGLAAGLKGIRRAGGRFLLFPDLIRPGVFVSSPQGDESGFSEPDRAEKERSQTMPAK